MRWFRGLAAVLASVVSPLLLVVAALFLAITDLCFLLFGKRKTPLATAVHHHAASVVIPNWNGRDLLEKFLPSVLAAVAGNSENEIIVVDNASADGSVEWLHQHFPQVRVLAMDRNLGFGGGSNAGFRAAHNDVVVLLNNDMRVEPGFLAPLLEPFADPLLFSVSCQIFFPDPAKRREETGLTETWWHAGRFLVQHRIDAEVDRLFPCAYPGGGSSAFDKRKFLELGGFDELFRPFYYEDTDLGMLAWKRGWKVLYEPRSVVVHEHRGTIGKKFSRSYIDSIVKKNAVLYCWKNIHDWRMLAGHFAERALSSFFSPIAPTAAGRASGLGSFRACLQIADAVHARWQARTLAAVSDREAFLRQKAGYFRDRFVAPQQKPAARLNVLFLSPYPIEPPVHGGGVLMKTFLEALAPLANIHLVSFVDNPIQLSKQDALRPFCASAHFIVRKDRRRVDPSSTNPTVLREFADPEFAWTLHRTTLLENIDLVQIEYTMMAQYRYDYSHIPSFLFEHDISFQAMGRRLRAGKPHPGLLLAYLQLLYFELHAVKRFARVQVCTEENKAFLLSYAPELGDRIDADLRAIINTEHYPYIESGRQPDTLLFAGSFNHQPNVQGLMWFLDQVFPRVLSLRPQVRLLVAGSGNLEPIRPRMTHPNIEILGFVPDIVSLYDQCAVLICPVLSGSGIRVKLLEAFATGIPVVSTGLGAEGFVQTNEPVCAVADTPLDFANATARLLSNPLDAIAMARRARALIESRHDAKKQVRRLLETYHQAQSRTARNPRPAQGPGLLL